MKYFIVALCALVSQFAIAQKRLPVVKATSAKAKITEQGNPPISWNISPKIKLDVHTTNKVIHSNMVTFKTDTDSIQFKMKPGMVKDFIVLLNGKDSCLTRIQSPGTKDYSKITPEFHDTIPFIINKYNTFYIKAIVNKTDTLNLNFDSGCTDIILTEEALKTKVKSGISFYNTPYELKMGSRTYTSNIYDAALSGHETDGRFGWNFFDGMVVELDYDRNIMVVHSKLPKAVKKDKEYSKLDIKYFNSLFVVEGSLFQNGIKNTQQYLFDTGFQSTLMLDNDLLTKDNFPVNEMEIIETIMMHGGANNEIPLTTYKLEKIQLGKSFLTDLPAQVLMSNKPMRGANIHIMGNDILKRFNIVMDFRDNVVYLKPNHLFDDQYLKKDKN